MGAYHFFRFDCDGKRQAINFLDAVKDCELQLPAAIDIEEWGNPAGYATEIINERIATMLAIVNVERGPVVIYTNKNGDARFVRHTYDRLDGSDRTCGSAPLPTLRSHAARGVCGSTAMWAKWPGEGQG